VRFGELIQSLTREIDPNNVRIRDFPNIVWLFGGPTSVKSRKAFCSFRNVFLNRLHATNHAIAKLVRIPEDYPEWNTFEGYPDLLEFERDAGYLAKATVVFCEGPGAFAELGAFASDSHLSARTVVVIQKAHSAPTSYITLGPAKRIDGIDGKSICVIEAKKAKDFPAEVGLVISAVEEKINKTHKSEAYDATSIRDQFLLIADLIDLFQAITEEELLLILPTFAVHILPPRLRQLLRQLLLFELVAREQIGYVKYYVPSSNSQKYVDYQARSGLPAFDRMRFKTTAFAVLSDEQNRLKAFQRVRQM
jgi:hypothetical protein